MDPDLGRAVLLKNQINTHIYTKCLQIYNHIDNHTKIFKMYTQMCKKTLKMDTKPTIHNHVVKIGDPLLYQNYGKNIHIDNKMAKKYTHINTEIVKSIPICRAGP